MRASGEALPGQVRITFLEQYVAGNTRMFGLFSEWNGHNRLKFAPVDEWRCTLLYQLKKRLTKGSGFLKGAEPLREL